MHLQLSAAGILAVAASVYAVLQSAKKAGLDQFLSGRVAAGFAAALAAASTIALAGNLSVNTICTAIAVALAAAGIHAHVKTIGNGVGSTITKAALLLLVITLPATGLVSCGARANVTVPQATQNLALAANLTDSVAQGLEVAQTSLRTLHQAGTVTDVEAASLNQRIVQVAQKNDAAIAAIKAAAGANPGANWQSAVEGVAAAAATLKPGTFGISNPTASESFSVAMATFEAASNAIATTF